jgi:hypothetical protein
MPGTSRPEVCLRAQIPRCSAPFTNQFLSRAVHPESPFGVESDRQRLRSTQRVEGLPWRRPGAVGVGHSPRHDRQSFGELQPR